MTAAEIRSKIIETVADNGGHLASSLGAVELAIALKQVFEPERDRIVWDVGHQAYAWKILNGRAENFSTLRKLDGISGFTNPFESRADATFAGHAGAALSTALGFAAARDRRKSGEHVVAVVGDASIVNGHSFEAMNHSAAATSKVIVVLNDNDMAISKPSGSFSKFLGRLITGIRYNRVKRAAENAGHVLKLTFLRGIYHRLESRIKSMFLGNALFEQFGLRYIGPVDGHNLNALVDALTVAKNDKRSVLVHVVTKKGMGFAPAEKNPTRWHGVGAFDREAALAKQRQETAAAKPSAPGWSEVFGAALSEAARKDSRIVALTAAMKDGTGLTEFARNFPDRFFDVGIAEGHMMGFAAGMAAGGLRPVVAVYSTFLQRAIDQVMHDICLAKLPVVICVDRAGVVGADGMTHQGLFDIAMLRSLPNIVICQPKDDEDLKSLLNEALQREGPTVIRYPRGKAIQAAKSATEKQENNDQSANSVAPAKTSAEKPAAFALWATGDWYAKAQSVAAALGGVAVHARYIKPLDTQLLKRQIDAGMKIYSLENASAIGGLGAAISEAIAGFDNVPASCRHTIFGWPDEFIAHGTQAELERRYGLDRDSLIERISHG